ncbi:hypothetical protein [Candidatus Symbiopectobacterium sp. 'North America']|uniref:hypothetical protein n=1 Tax=Candidatus Symbiopectobacterium sp. 'North America' TaxID=2794574 RepID=UPI001FD36E65|nr:hypothetical protein [Candidatus Symbiopectobacterium sp. 'North America']
MRKLASAFNIQLGTGGKKEIKTILTDNLNKISYEKLKSFVIDILSQRFKLTSTNFLENINVGNKVTINDLDFLSHYSKIKHTHALVQGSVLEQLK